MRSKNQYPSPIEQAVDEQAECALPVPEINKFVRPVKRIWKKYRRRTETIFAEAADKNREIEAQNNRRKRKHNKRRRKRGPRALVVRFNKSTPKL